MSTDKDKVTRKLRAILSADVKGYSLLMANDEAYTIKKLEAYRGSMSELIRSHSGRVVDAVGDNLLAEFSSVVDAVRCAVEIQKDLQQKNADLSADKRLEFRIGVNIGDVIQEGDRIYGNGVNVAARIEGLAESGGICISRNAYSHVRDKLELGYEYLGEHSVKNIKRPVKVYKVLMNPEDAGKLIGDVPKRVTKNWVWATAVLAVIVITAVVWQVYQKMTEPKFEPAKVQEMAYPLPEKPSIAVLAFDNMSDDPSQEYFSDGIAEDIITTLSKSDDLFVVARNSTFRYKGKPVNIKQVSEELGVRHVLEGSVRKYEDRVRITAQLIDAVAGNHLWAERYERDINDIFALQDEITLKIVTALEVKLTEGEQVLRSRRFTNLDVKLKFMEVLSLWRKGTQESRMRHGQLSQELIDMAPEFEGGYVHLGWHYVFLANVGKSPEESIAKAFTLAQKALSLNESDPFAYALLSYLHVNIRDYDKAIAAGERGVALNPNGADNHFSLGMTLGYADKQDEAIDHLMQAIRLDPFPEYYYFLHLSNNYRMKGQYEKALSEIKKALHISPDNFLSNMNLAAIYAFLDRQVEAEAASKRALEIDPKFTVKRATKTWPYKNKADLKLLYDALLKAGFPEYPSLQLPDKPSIAVLAFDNMSGDPGQEYFADGLSEEIITALSYVPELIVIARNSSFAYKGKSVNVEKISKELGVRYILEGSVRKEGEHLRITAQLINALKGDHLWAESYDRKMDEIFALQDEITMKIITELQVELTEGEKARAHVPCSSNLKAYLKYLKAKDHYIRANVQDNKITQRLAEEAIAIDPGYACAYSLLGATHLQKLGIGLAKSPEQTMKTADMLIRKAITLNPTLDGPHAMLSDLYRFSGELDKALEKAEKAFSINPNSPFGNSAMGAALRWDGRSEEAIPYLKHSIRVDPFSSGSLSSLGFTYFNLKRYDEGIEACQKAARLNVNSIYPQLCLAAICGATNREEGARAAASGVLNIYPQFSLERYVKTVKYKKKEDVEHLTSSLRKAGL